MSWTGAGSSGARLDADAFLKLENALFSLPWVADYRAVQKADGLHLEVRTCGKPTALPNLAAAWSFCPVRQEDRALIAGKRGVIHAVQSQ